MAGPNNRVKVAGIDLYERFGIVLSDGYTIGLPEPKEYSIDILGDGKVDLSEAMGDVFYENREIKLPFFSMDEMSQPKYEQEKTRIATFVHGKMAEIEFAVDPGYIYKGRIKVAEFAREMKHLIVTLTVDAEPYKTLGDVVFKANGAGGVSLILDNGRCRTQPTVEVYQDSILSYDGKDWSLNAGTWTLEDFWLGAGQNVITINTTPDHFGANVVSIDIEDVVLKDIEKRLISNIIQGDYQIQNSDTLRDIAFDVKKCNTTRSNGNSFSEDDWDDVAKLSEEIGIASSIAYEGMVEVWNHRSGSEFVSTIEAHPNLFATSYNREIIFVSSTTRAQINAINGTHGDILLVDEVVDDQSLSGMYTFWMYDSYAVNHWCLITKLSKTVQLDYIKNTYFSGNQAGSALGDYWTGAIILRGTNSSAGYPSAADGHVHVYVIEPEPPYEQGDYWIESNHSLSDYEYQRLIDLAHPVAPESVEFGNTNVYFKYEWRDL